MTYFSQRHLPSKLIKIQAIFYITENIRIISFVMNLLEFK